MDIEEIKQEVESVEAEIEVCRNEEDYVLLLKKQEIKQCILSKYAPRDAAKRLITNHSYNKETLWVVVGFMFGYVIDELIEIVGEEVKIIVIEPSVEVFNAQAEKVNMDRYKQCRNLHLLCGLDFNTIVSAYEQCIDASNFFNIKIVIDKPYLRFYGKFIHILLKKINASLEREIINQNTAKKIFDIMIKNNLCNQEAIMNSYDIRQHRNKFDNIPAVIVSAGPSLEKNIAYLKEFKGLVFTGGRTLLPILKQGVKPDFIAMLDSSDLIYDTFQGYAGTDIPLISEGNGCPKVIKESQGPKYFVENSMLITKDLFGIDLEMLPISGTVATLCLSAATYMGCNPIIFIGQDLAYTNMQTHTKDSQVFEKEKVNLIDRETRYIKGYNGDMVLSSPDLISFLNWIENFIEENSNIEYINATEGGAQIQGAKQRKFSDVVTEYIGREKPIITHIEHIDISDCDPKNCILKLVDYLQEILKIAIKGVRLSTELLAIIKTNKENQQMNRVNRILKELESKVDKEIMKCSDRPILGGLFGSIYNEVKFTEIYQGDLGESELQNKIRVAELNIKTYESIKASCERIIRTIKLTVEVDK